MVYIVNYKDMAKSDLKIAARNLRKNGESIKFIAKKLKVSASSASLWCRDIELSENQIESLLLRKEEGTRRGQLNGALVQKNKRLAAIEQYQKEGKTFFKKFSDKEFFSSGLALYLAEGTKNRQVEFTNSDPKVIRFIIDWFSKFFDITKNRIAPIVFINESHKSRESLVKNFWSNYLNVPVSQFRKTMFLKSVRKKLYENHNQYFGTLKLRILKSASLSYKISGLINALLDRGKLPA